MDFVTDAGDNHLRISARSYESAYVVRIYFTFHESKIFTGSQ